MTEIALVLYTTVRWKMTATGRAPSQQQKCSAQHPLSANKGALLTTHREGCSGASVPLCSADSASMSLAHNFSYEHLLLPHTSLNRGIIGQISISPGNVIIGIYSMFPSCLCFLLKCEMCSNTITVCRHSEESDE